LWYICNNPFAPIYQSIYNNPFATIYCIYLQQPNCNNITIYLQQPNCNNITIYLQQPNCNNITIYLQQPNCSYLQWPICKQHIELYLLQPTHLQQHTQGELLPCMHSPKLWLSLISQLVESVCTLAHFECCYHVKIFQKQHVTLRQSPLALNQMFKVRFRHQFHGHCLRYPLLTFLWLKTIGRNSFKKLWDFATCCYLLLLVGQKAMIQKFYLFHESSWCQHICSSNTINLFLILILTSKW
jgi:hypothetical protein